MDTPENIAEQVKLDLADENAKLVSYTSVKVVRTTGAGGGTTTRESIRMTRQWARITDGLRAHYEDKLRENLYVDNPMADGEIRAGRWRVIRVYSSPLKTDPSQQGVFQTLLYWPAEYGDFGDFCSESTPLNHVDVKIYADSPDLADCAHAFECGHIFQAVNRLDLETGLWHGEMRDDKARRFPSAPGSAVEGWSGSRTEHRKRREARNDTTVPFPTKAALVDALKDGRTIQSDFNINRYALFDWGTVEVFHQMYPPDGEDAAKHIHGSILVRQTTTARVNDTDLPDDDQPEEPGTTTDISFALTADGFFNWTHNLDEAQQFPAKDAPKAEITYGGPLLRVTHREQLNDGALPVIEAADMLPGKNIRAQFSINRFGWYDWSTEREEPQPFPTDEPAEVVYGGPLSEITHQERVNDINLPPVAPGEVGHNTRIQFSINRFARYDWSMEDELAKAFPVAGPEEIVYGGPLSSITHQEQANDDTLPTIARGTAGHNTRAQFNINRFGLYDWSTDDEEAHVFPASGPAEITYGGPLATVKHKEQVNASSLPQIAPGVAGKNTRAQFSINRFGWYDWSTDDEEAHVFPASGPAEITYGGPLSVIMHREQVNASSLPQIGVGVTGHNTRAQFNINRFGWYDWSTDDEAAKPASTTWQESSKYEVTVGISFDNHMAMPAHPSATGVGTPIVRVQVGINRFGCLDGTITVTTGVEFSSSSVTLEDSYQQKVTRKWHFNQSSPPSGTTKSLSGGSVKIKTFQPELNRFGLWDYSETETTIHTGAGGVMTYFLYGQPYALRTESATSILYQRYKDKYTHTLRVHETMAAAYDAISGNALSSSVREIAGGVFLSDSVEITPEFISQVALEK